MTAPPSTHTGATDRRTLWLTGLLPLALLGVLVLLLFRAGPLGLLRTSFPPVEELTIERIWMPAQGEIRLRVVNGGPEPVTIAQVMVDEAVWSHTIDGPRTVGRLESRVITLSYPWVEGEPVSITLLTSTGLTFEGTVDVATQAPAADLRHLGAFTLLGTYVGVLPVCLGLLWLPFLRRVGRRWVDFFLALTIGLLIFLGFDALGEAIETADAVPGAYQGTALVLIGVIATPLLIGAVNALRGGVGDRNFRLAGLIALAIGLHNLGEGLAIGAAYSAGAIALGTFLVLGFLLHNTTEGLAIVAPVADSKPRISTLIGLAMIAGLPTILGTWIGGFVQVPAATTLFLAVGAGAAAQVVVELVRFFHRRGARLTTTPLNAAGILLGLFIMYATGLLVAA